MQMAIDRVNDEVVMRYCSEVPAASRCQLRRALSEECDDCGIAVRCPGEIWSDVLDCVEAQP